MIRSISPCLGHWAGEESLKKGGKSEQAPFRGSRGTDTSNPGLTTPNGLIHSPFRSLGYRLRRYELRIQLFLAQFALKIMV